jgi:hypothetical protein
MLRYLSDKQLKIEGFETPFEAHLNPENKWVKLANTIPWDEFVGIYTRSMSKEHGRPSISPRLAVAALIIKHMEQLDDRRVVAALEENVYMQYFAGFPSFTAKPPFDASLLVEMRVRMGAKSFDEMNVAIIQKAQSLIEEITEKGTSKKKKGPGKKSETEKNDLDGNRDDNPSINSNIEENETGKTDSSANVEMVEEKQEDQADQAVAPSGADTENVIEILKNAVNIDNVIIKTDFPKENEATFPANQGKLKIDATVADQKIKYPTDIGLLNRSREESERLIDIIYGQTAIEIKPRTYRKKARKEYLSVAMKKKKTKREIRSIIGKQLRYLKRNLQTIDVLLDEFKETLPLCYRDLRILWVIRHIYDQQKTMYDLKVHSHPHRIVNIYQPHVRAIPRGKDKHSIEFGAKLGVSEICGFSRIDRISWEAYSESKDLVLQVENYKKLFGYYPEVVLADGAYLGSENRKYLKEKRIRHTGKALGRPKQMTRAEKLAIKKERGERNHVEGKFGQAKNGYGLTDIRARRKDTSEAWIGGIWLAMNLKRYMDLLSKVGLMAIIQMVIVLLWAFLGKIRTYGRAVVAQLGGTMGISAFSSGLQPGYWGTPYRATAI